MPKQSVIPIAKSSGSPAMKESPAVNAVKSVNKASVPKTPQKRRSKTNLSVVLRQWHQRTGLFAFFFMGWLGISGFLLNQSAAWGLDAIRVKSTAIMSMYGLHTQVPDSGFIEDGHWVVTTTEQTVIDSHQLDQRIPSPIGLSVVGEGEGLMLFVATEDAVLVYSGDGAKLDEISDYMLPVAAVEKIGTATTPDGKQMVAIKGESAYVSADGLGWETMPDVDSVQWSSPQKLSEKIKSQVEPFARPTVALEQLLIDLHSGRLFGKPGSYVINVVGFASLVLSVSGVWMMWRTSRRRKVRP